jgi:hypothetical protein
LKEGGCQRINCFPRSNRIHSLDFIKSFELISRIVFINRFKAEENNSKVFDFGNPLGNICLLKEIAG